MADMLITDITCLRNKLRRQAPNLRPKEELVFLRRNKGSRKHNKLYRLLARLQTSALTIRTLSSSNSFSQNIPSCLWKLGRLNHVAIAVPDLEKAQSLYKDVLGAEVSETIALPEHGVYTVFVELGNTKLELLHPLGDKSPIASFLQKNKTGGMHHICIEVDDIKAAMTELKKKKIRILSEEPKIGAHGKPVIFLHPKDCHGVLVELEQA
ncbi:methylmalonyl-CoA epimerase, mitochondrial [Athene cunicularia]|uniref:methylmalonyl-CoA epimerase, mitochondrial n=1 Tax=Athene cunicularia TaxID=194338 RepID=UPI000EF707D3|nr:methylmalonyl-CoA epimerase, mitochondrial [Athene cunicularia]